MLLVLLGAVVAAREREDQGIIALNLAQAARRVRVIGQLVVRKNGPRCEVVAHLVSFVVGLDKELNACHEPLGPVQVWSAMLGKTSTFIQRRDWLLAQKERGRPADTAGRLLTRGLPACL